MILVVDNYDSFTYNLVQLLAPFEEEARVIRNDAMTAEEAITLQPSAIILSPGPCDPDQAGICLALVTLAKKARIPLFGVCLGHQAIAQAHGGTIVRAGVPMHGKVSKVRFSADPLFAGIESPFTATRYHSLSVARAGLPDEVEVLAEAEDDGEIMALKVRGHLIYGVQYHPESYASEGGAAILNNFLRMARERQAA
ncbi:MAG: aminodeoxychorismate/anthranilate synthase component II [Pseudomonadota bacterium]